MVVSERKSKAERRAEILDAALSVFAEQGLHGASTEDIARRAGISQPYVFRLFGTKKELFKAVVARCFRETLQAFRQAADGARGEEALQAIGQRYRTALETNRLYLLVQMQAYVACEDPEICEVVRTGYGDLVAYVERVSGADSATVSAFFAKGMLMNVLAAMQVQDGSEPWARRLLEGCGKEL
jgi:AcrR family transcriptional regulator